MHIIFIMLGISFVLIGMITIFLPVPMGIISLAIGLALLITGSKQVRDGLRWLRRKFKKIDSIFDKAEEVLPRQISRPLHETDPEDEEDEETEDEDPVAKEEDRRLSATAPPSLPTLKRRPVPSRYRPGARPRG